MILAFNDLFTGKCKMKSLIFPDRSHIGQNIGSVAGVESQVIDGEKRVIVVSVAGGHAFKNLVNFFELCPILQRMFDLLDVLGERVMKGLDFWFLISELLILIVNATE